MMMFFLIKKRLVISVDTYVEGVHFIDFQNPDLVIKKIIRSSISDLICKGVKPKYYFISGSGNKKSFTKKNLAMISKSLNQEQKNFQLIYVVETLLFQKNYLSQLHLLGFQIK